MSPLILICGLLAGYLAGSIPFSNIVAHFHSHIDLREVGSGTVTPRNLHDSIGLYPSLIAGALELAKGTIGPLIIGPRHLLVAAIAGALAVAGHNWSVFLRGAGGRGVSTATGVLAVIAWPGLVVMGAGLVVGAAIKRVGLMISVAFALLLPVLGVVAGVTTICAVLIVLAPVGIKTAMEVRRRGLPFHRTGLRISFKRGPGYRQSADGRPEPGST
jgi:glycerol-3-phosphate acyltransferase PlsY